MAGSVPMIVAGGFTVDSGQEHHPVFFLTVNGQRIVVKGEAKGSQGHERSDADTAVSVKWSSKLMKNVNDPLVNTKILDPTEVAAFLAAARHKYRQLPAAPGEAPPPVAHQHHHVSDPMASQYMWVKMPMVEGLSDADFMVRVDGFARPMPGKAREQIAKFGDERIWSQLGKVLAVDIFNGNSDRFDIATGRWQNYGNVMFRDEGTRVIGLDTFDPNTPQSNLVGHGGFNELRTLIDPGLRRDFALKCARSVGRILRDEAFAFREDARYVTLQVDGPEGPILWKVTADQVEHMYEVFAPAMADGIAEGATQLRSYLRDKVALYRQRARPLPVPGQAPPPGGPPHAPLPMPPGAQVAPIPGFPQGILERMNYLGWL